MLYCFQTTFSLRNLPDLVNNGSFCTTNMLGASDHPTRSTFRRNFLGMIDNAYLACLACKRAIQYGYLEDINL